MTDWIKTPFNLKKMKKCYQKWYDAMNGKAWHTLYLENHDHPRIVDRYGSLKYREASAKMLATMCYMQKGTPFIYQGQEIGMTNGGFKSPYDFKDVESLNYFKEQTDKGMTRQQAYENLLAGSRDNCRTPMCWSTEENAGFTTGTPYLSSSLTRYSMNSGPWLMYSISSDSRSPTARASIERTSIPPYVRKPS